MIEHSNTCSKGAENGVIGPAARIAIGDPPLALGKPAVAGNRVQALADARPEQPHQRDQRDAEGQRDQDRGEVVLRGPDADGYARTARDVTLMRTPCAG